MSRIARIAIVVALVACVAAVIVIKRSGAKPESNSGRPDPVATKTVSLPRLVDLGSTTCIPCKMMMPVLDGLKQECAGRLQVEFVDINQNGDAAQQYGIRVIPTQVFFDASGKEVFRHEGFISREDILAKWQELGVDLGAAGASGPPGPGADGKSVKSEAK
jgi:thioredoxin 1